MPLVPLKLHSRQHSKSGLKSQFRYKFKMGTFQNQILTQNSLIEESTAANI